MALEDFSKEKIELSRAVKPTNPDIKVPVPEGLAYKDYQLAAIEYALTPPYRTLIADDMGLGKTIEAIGFINFMAQPEVYTGHRFLIVCPAYLKMNWREELKKWLVRPFSIGIAYSGKSFPVEKIAVINYEILHLFKKELDSEMWEVMVLDEAHRLQNKDSRRTIMVYGGVLKENRNPDTEKMSIAATSARPCASSSGLVNRQKAVKYKQLQALSVLNLTGTPAYNRPINLWTQLKNLRPEIFNNFYSFARRYCDAKKTPFGWDLKGASNLEELGERLRATCMARRLKKDVAAELPDKIIKWLPFELENINSDLNISHKIKEGLCSFDALSKKGEEKRREQLATLRLETGKKKVPFVRNLIKNICQQHETDVKIVVFAYHREVVGLLFRLFQQTAVSIMGAETAKQRENKLKRFCEGSKNLLIGTMDAIGEGLNLQVSYIGVFAELDWSSEKLRQAEDRLLRIGQNKTVHIFYPRLLNSIDDLLVAVAFEKSKNLKYLTGD